MATDLYPVRLDADQRGRLQEIVRNGRTSAARIRRANVLLMADRNRPGGGMPGREISAALGMHVNTVDRIRKRFALQGEEAGLERTPVPGPADRRTGGAAAGGEGLGGPPQRRRQPRRLALHHRRRADKAPPFVPGGLGWAEH